MTASAVIFGAWGVALLFAPAELGRALGWGEGTAAPSLAASGLLALAILDWTGRGAIYGGIYGRPIVLANLMLGVTGASSLLRHALDHPGSGVVVWLPVLVLGAHALAFGLLLMGRLGRGPAA